MSIELSHISDFSGYNIVIYDEMTHFIQLCKKLECFDRLRFLVKIIDLGYYEEREGYYTHLVKIPTNPEDRHKLPNFEKRHEILRITILTEYHKAQAYHDKFFNEVRITPGGRGNIMMPWFLIPIPEKIPYGLYKKPDFDILYNIYLTSGWKGVYDKYNLYDRKLHRSQSLIHIPVMNLKESSDPVRPNNRKFNSDNHNLPKKEDKIRQFRIQHEANKLNVEQTKISLKNKSESKDKTFIESLHQSSHDKTKLDVEQTKISLKNKMKDRSSLSLESLSSSEEKSQNKSESKDKTFIELVSKSKDNIFSDIVLDEKIKEKQPKIREFRIQHEANKNANRLSGGGVGLDILRDDKRHIMEEQFLNNLHYSIRRNIVEERKYEGPRNCIKIFNVFKFHHTPPNPNYIVELKISLLTIDIERNTDLLLDLLSTL